MLEGAAILEMDGKPSQTFKAGQAFAEMPNMIHNFKNASTTEAAKGLGFQIAARRPDRCESTSPEADGLVVL